MKWHAALAIAGVLAGLAVPATGHDALPDITDQVGFDPHPGARVALGLPFRDDTGRAGGLAAMPLAHPLVLVLVQFRCRDLCPLILEGLASVLRESRLLPGRDYNVVVVSIDPAETPAMAASARRALAGRIGQGDALPGWRLLTGPAGSITALARSVGFRYAWDPRTEQFAHPAGAVIVTPDGRIARYLFGMGFDARDLRLAVVEASAGHVGSVVDQLLLTCYHYDATAGRYTATVMNVVRAGAGSGALALAALIVWLVRADRARARRRGGASVL
jgi:protein SCO1/2